MSTSTSADLQDRLDDLLGHIRDGRILEAMREFYAPDVTMEEPAYGATVGLDANVTREEAFVDSVAAWKRFDVVATAVGPNTTMYESIMDWTTTDGRDVHVEQVAVATWKDGRIVRERFYYDTGA